MILRSTRLSSPEVSFREALLRGLAPDGGLYLPGRAHAPGSRDDGVVARPADRRGGGAGARAPGRRRVRPGGLRRARARRVQLPGSDGAGWATASPCSSCSTGRRWRSRTSGRGSSRGSSGTCWPSAATTRRSSWPRPETPGAPWRRGSSACRECTVVVLYPAGKVSRFQEAQMATLGGNVRALRVPGTFDDCQRLVKQAFLDPGLAALNLSSANSINIGRLLPQSVYYVASWLDAGGPDAGEVVFAVPSGNLGNLTAGVIAQRIGLPVGAVHRRLERQRRAARVPRQRQLRARGRRSPTISNAMDVGDPSNFPRLAQLHAEAIGQLRANLLGWSVTDDETRRVIRERLRGPALPAGPARGRGHGGGAPRPARIGRTPADRHARDGAPGEVLGGDSAGAGVRAAGSRRVARLGVAPAPRAGPGRRGLRDVPEGARQDVLNGHTRARGPRTSPNRGLLFRTSRCARQSRSNSA